MSKMDVSCLLPAASINIQWGLEKMVAIFAEDILFFILFNEHFSISNKD